jgi:hypothetical protein
VESKKARISGRAISAATKRPGQYCPFWISLGALGFPLRARKFKHPEPAGKKFGIFWAGKLTCQPVAEAHGLEFAGPAQPQLRGITRFLSG